jgi:carboxypeptidase family protein/TonB-dependent receptor-like protein
MKRVGLALALVLGLLPSAYAQYSGNIYGSVTDESGAVLPGATVKLTSPLGTRETTTGQQGDFRFLNLDSGNYTLSVALAGFTNVTREVNVTTGQNVNVAFPLKVASVEETVTVTAETPIVDTKKVGTTTTLTKEELAQVPNARDPWAILRTVPGIIQDRVNIGGNENGQQASFVGKGDNGNNAMWNLDGVVITDTGSLSSPTYYDFDAFEEISVTTGGNDVRVQTGGVGINFQTRRGTNQFRGSVHGFLTHDDLQSNNLPDVLKTDARLKGAEKGDHIQQIADFGGELGGPIVKDKLWFYGSWGRQDIRLIRINQTSDKTRLTSYNGKLNWQAGSNDMVSLFYFNGAKEKEGRLVGFGITEEDTFLWNQGNNYQGGPHGFTKAEWNHTFSPSFFLSTKGSYYNTGFFLSPRGGDINGTADFSNGVASGAYYDVNNLRPALTGNVDANYFKAGTGGNHEFKFGFGYRKFEVQSTTHWGGNQLFSYIFGPGSAYTHVSRDSVTNTEAAYWSAYVGDTFTKDRFTLNAGVRYDHQMSGNKPYTLPANKSFPEILGAVNFDGNTEDIEWSDVSPRVGLTYALDASRKTVLRASYARYASQLPSGQASFLAPSQSPGSYFAYIWEDTSGDGFAQPNEVRTDLGVQYTGYVNANDPNGPSANRLDPNYKAQHDNEFIVGLDRELFANMAVSLAYTHRNSTDISWNPRIGLTSADYTPRQFTRNGFTATGYIPNSDKVEAVSGGRILLNRPDYRRGYDGFEATILKRLSNRWMARVALTYNDFKEYYDGPGAIQNPTRTDTDHLGNLSGPQADGGQYAPRASGSGKGDAIIGAKWQVVANTLFQLPAGFELSGALFGRQGHPFAVIFRQSLGDDGAVRILANEIPELDAQRYDNVWNLDLRLAKNFRLGGSSFTVSADAFNVLNNDVVLNRFRQASSGNFNRLDELLNPRVIRFGMRFQF